MDIRILRAWNIHYYNLFNLYSDKYTMYIDLEARIDKENLCNSEILSMAIYLYNEDRLTPITIYGNEMSIMKKLNFILRNKIIGRIVGYGIMYFDIPLLIFKARKYDLKEVLHTFTIATPMDLVIPSALYMYAKTKRFRFYSLKEMVSMLGLDEKYEFTEDILNDTKKLIEYNLRDLNNVKKLYDFLADVYKNLRFVNELKI